VLVARIEVLWYANELCKIVDSRVVVITHSIIYAFPQCTYKRNVRLRAIKCCKAQDVS